jgi:pimeloyl-ACP methyl ester carboxylesterase
MHRGSVPGTRTSIRRRNGPQRRHPAAEASWYDGVGHLPHLQEHERFNSELAALTRRARTRAGPGGMP